MELQWKYQIGDVLVHRATLLKPVPLGNVRLLVTERVSQTCPGGTQLFYLCRPVNVSAAGVTMTLGGDKFLEEELAPFAEYAALLEERNQQDAADEEKRYSWRAVK